MNVIDYLTELVLAGPVTATQTTTDAINAVKDTRLKVHDLLAHSLLNDVTDPNTGTVTKVILVSDNDPCYNSGRFARYTASRPELTHVRTRRKSPQTNGVTERYHGTIHIEALWRDLPADGLEMTEKVEPLRHLCNRIRPHEAPARSNVISPTRPAPQSRPKKYHGLLDAGQSRSSGLPVVELWTFWRTPAANPWRSACFYMLHAS